MSRLSIVLLVALAACGDPSARSADGPGREVPDAAAPAPLAMLDIDPNPDELPVVRGSIDGRPARLLIDTGASATIVSATWLGVPPDQGVHVQSLCLGAVCLPLLGAWAADTPFSQPQPEAIQAVVGMNALDRFVLDLDRGRTIALWAAAPDCGGSVQRLEFDQEGRPLLEARLDDRTLGRVLLDSGSRYSLLDAESAAGAPYLAQNAMETGACSINGCTTTGSFVAAARQLCAGAVCLTDVEVKFPAWNAIGGSFLRRVRMIADLARATIAFCP